MRTLLTTFLTCALGLAAEAGADPAVETAKAAYAKACDAADAAYAKSVEAADKDRSDKLAKAAQPLIAAYKAAVKKTMAKGDLATANQLNEELAQIEGGKGMKSNLVWRLATELETFRVTVVGPIPKDKTPDPTKVLSAVKAGKLDSLGSSSMQEIPNGKNWNGISAGTTVIFQAHIKSGKATNLKYSIDFGGAYSSAQLYLNGNTIVKAGVSPLPAGESMLLIILNSGVENYINIRVEGDGVCLLASPDNPKDAAK